MTLAHPRHLALAVLIALPALAAAQHSGHAGHGAPATPAAETTPAQSPWAEAEVRRIDTAAGKISLKHGEIRNLDMPPMTMVFQLRDPASLTGLAVGDKVRFTADKVRGAYTVLQIEKQP
jgi:Cu/Ag efflux protein CusF